MISEIKNCQKCNLYVNQLPLLDLPHKNAIMVVGLSAKKMSSCEAQPLSNHTRSGKLVSSMETIAQNYGYTIYRTNLVKCVPLDSAGKIRYPSSSEINSCFNHIIKEIKVIHPPIVILFGKIVHKAFESQLGIDLPCNNGCSFDIQHRGDIALAPVYHPSYILRSKERVATYLENFENLVSEMRV